MKASHLVLASLAGLLCACGSSRGTNQPTLLTQTQRFDPATRAWVPVNSVTVMPATVSPHSLPPEKTGENVKVLNASSTAPPPVSSPAPLQEEEKPGFMKRLGRAATSPLRLVGIGDKPA
jgi:hypothetical protein